jgi:hypothetical protein
MGKGREGGSEGAREREMGGMSGSRRVTRVKRRV